MKFETEYIDKLAKIITDNGLTEISLEDGDQAITVRRDVVVSSKVHIQDNTINNPVSVSDVSVTSAQEPQVTSESKPSGTPISSPMVGTFYMAPSPDAEPFVKAGQLVHQGDVVCIIEAMKMMNEIKAEVSGKIVEVCVEDGQPVEFGQVLMYVE